MQRKIAGYGELQEQWRGAGMRGLVAMRRRDVRSLVREDRVLREELDNLLAEEELYWAQRAKQRWLELGNRNSRYFH